MSSHIKWKPLLFAMLIALTLYLLPNPTSLSANGWYTLIIATLMILCWVTEALPLAITSFFPLILMPLGHILSAEKLASAYGNRLVFLFLGGFLLAVSLQKSHLHKRMALMLIQRIGHTPKRLILAFIISASFLSMWISNTATTLMLVPIAQSVLSLQNDKATRQALSKPLLFSVAYASSIGGIATLIGTPPNALLSGFLLESYQYNLGFAQWFAIAMPFVVLALPVLYFVLVKFSFSLQLNSPQDISSALDVASKDIASKLTTMERRVGLIFMLTIIAWFSRYWLSAYVPGLNDTSIALSSAAILFVLPADKRAAPILNVKDFKFVAWPILILLGGGLALAAALKQNHVDTWLAGQLMFIQHLPHFAILLLLVSVVLLCTETMSKLV